MDEPNHHHLLPVLQLLLLLPLSRTTIGFIPLNFFHPKPKRAWTISSPASTEWSNDSIPSSLTLRGVNSGRPPTPWPLPRTCRNIPVSTFYCIYRPSKWMKNNSYKYCNRPRAGGYRTSWRYGEIHPGGSGRGYHRIHRVGIVIGRSIWSDSYENATGITLELPSRDIPKDIPAVPVDTTNSFIWKTRWTPEPIWSLHNYSTTWLFFKNTYKNAAPMVLLVRSYPALCPYKVTAVSNAWRNIVKCRYHPTYGNNWNRSGRMTKPWNESDVRLRPTCVDKYYPSRMMNMMMLIITIVELMGFIFIRWI